MQASAGDEPVDPRLLEAVREGLADAAAGRVYSHEDVVEALRQRMSSYWDAD